MLIAGMYVTSVGIDELKIAFLNGWTEGCWMDNESLDWPINGSWESKEMLNDSNLQVIEISKLRHLQPQATLYPGCCSWFSLHFKFALGISSMFFHQKWKWYSPDRYTQRYRSLPDVFRSKKKPALHPAAASSCTTTTELNGCSRLLEPSPTTRQTISN